MSKLLCLCVTSLVCDRKLDGVCGRESVHACEA